MVAFNSFSPLWCKAYCGLRAEQPGNLRDILVSIVAEADRPWDIKWKRPRQNIPGQSKWLNGGRPNNKGGTPGL